MERYGRGSDERADLRAPLAIARSSMGLLVSYPSYTLIDGHPVGLTQLVEGTSSHPDVAGIPDRHGVGPREEV